MSGKPDERDRTAYPKIPGPFWRDPATNELTDQWSSPELEATADLDWVWTEKIDGTNIRVIWDGYRVTFGGRTARAQLPITLHAWLVAHFAGPEREQLFEQKFGSSPAVLYGEGYGAGIQKGGHYRPDQSVVFYDVLVDDRWWLRRDDVRDICEYFGLELIPGGWQSTLVDAIALVRTGDLASYYPGATPEGLVGSTTAGLRGRGGQRLIVKLKPRDLAPKEH